MNIGIDAESLAEAVKELAGAFILGCGVLGVCYVIGSVVRSFGRRG